MNSYYVLAIVGPRYDKNKRCVERDGIILADDRRSESCDDKGQCDRMLSEFLAFPLIVPEVGDNPPEAFFMEAKTIWGQALRDRLNIFWDSITHVSWIPSHGSVKGVYLLQLNEEISGRISRGRGKEHDMVMSSKGYVMGRVRQYYSRARPETRNREEDRFEYSYMHCDQLYVLQCLARRLWPEPTRSSRACVVE